MTGTLRIAADARLQIAYSVGELQNLVTPFITAIATTLEQSTDLERAVLDAAHSFPDAAACFIIEPSRIAETFSLSDEHLFAERRVSRLRIITDDDTYSVEIGSASDLQVLQQVLYTGSVGQFALNDRSPDLGEPARELLQQLSGLGVVTDAPAGAGCFASADAPGIHRLQHASLLYRSRTSGVLVDPHMHSSYRPGELRSDVLRDAVATRVDAILISHFHEDHFFLSTLLMFPLDTPIVVPKVPRGTIICGDMERILHDCGFTNVVAVDWFSPPIIFGDIAVHVLPFYGEQPLRFDESKHPDLRNWGNTYFIETEAYSSWFLIDSGSDRRGSMEDVAHYVSKRFGRVDTILSNLRRFSLQSPFYINGGLNWLTLSPAQMRNFRGMRQDCITLGPEGVAAICRIVDAKHYLPYAHWWGELGEEARSGLDTPGQEEVALVSELGRRLVAAGSRTQILNWAVGDGFVSRGRGQFLHERIVNSTGHSGGSAW
ncbi:MAG TPA: MBL fold metallo-hydrolase [Gemmatimonadaceae bacterium]|jgi:L-ascorbate metabolism protein UlaG (beta-lactamase superfamily)